MSIPKLCLRLAVFLCTLTIALFVTRLFLIPPRVEVRVATPAKVNFKVQQVVLDPANGEAHVQLSIEQDPNAPVPLFGMWLTSSKLGGGCGDAVPQPLPQSDTLIAVFHCGIYPDELTNSFYAHIVPMQPTDSLNHFTYSESDVSPAIPVVVEHWLKH